MSLIVPLILLIVCVLVLVWIVYAKFSPKLASNRDHSVRPSEALLLPATVHVALHRPERF